MRIFIATVVLIAGCSDPAIRPEPIRLEDAATVDEAVSKWSSQLPECDVFGSDRYGLVLIQCPDFTTVLSKDTIP